MLVDKRDPECVAQWSDCLSGEYNPACCRFPKSCSAGDIEWTPNKYTVRRPHGNYGLWVVNDPESNWLGSFWFWRQAVDYAFQHARNHAR